MLKFSKKVEYALMGILYMSQKPADKLTTARELAESFNIPQHLMGKVLQYLSREGIVESVQGVKGGYRLPRSLRDIKLSEVVQAVEGPVTIVSCVESEDCCCDQLIHCNIRSPMEAMNARLMEFFATISVADLQQQSTGSVPVYFEN